MVKYVPPANDNADARRALAHLRAFRAMPAPIQDRLTHLAEAIMQAGDPANLDAAWQGLRDQVHHFRLADQVDETEG
ncbi:hypothetical protein [Magnetospirillum sp. UT-4]|uniref:hypothetical protein n=1 Tax=Magnetospirillum sp. UT-4 TaxID=2681467 RepID=UPI00137DA866|nr:hypothetical protein [Magnetospirillum sp. UT-4]CAA7619263.1 hypothetical protein MTBUT4_300016 [Magnetospirillum sp. UT-4]